VRRTGIAARPSPGRIQSEMGRQMPTVARGRYVTDRARGSLLDSLLAPFPR